VGTSEFLLRFPSVLAGAALPWVMYQWISSLFGRPAGLVSALLSAFSPPLIALSAEVRQYAVLLLCMTAALYFLERTFRTGSLRALGAFTACLYLAILTHYSALWLTVAIAAYGFLQMAGRQMSRRVAVAWVASQVGAALLYVALYVTHLSHLRGSGMEQEANRGWLHAFYFHSGEGSAAGFVLRQSMALASYLFEQRELGIALLILVVAGGLALLAGQGAARGEDRGRSRALAVLFLLPFALAIGAALTGRYPYGGSRHDVILILCAIAVLSFSLARLSGPRAWPGLLAAGAAVIVQLVHGRVPALLTREHSDQLGHMRGAMSYLRSSVPHGALLFTDYQTSLELGYYLGKDQVTKFDDPQRDLMEHSYGDYRVVSPQRWMFGAQDFGREFDGLVRAYGLKPGEQVWVVRIGWGPNLADELAKALPAFQGLSSQRFGENISIFQITVGRRQVPSTGPRNPST
jgi:4-amino-4-deoxy-L-arabinose transferase-like glycosyltransferase